jgi:hypothetical protein
MVWALVFWTRQASAAMVFEGAGFLDAPGFGCDGLGAGFLDAPGFGCDGLGAGFLDAPGFGCDGF